MEERMPKLFAYGHLGREDLLAVSKPFAELTVLSPLDRLTLPTEEPPA